MNYNILSNCKIEFTKVLFFCRVLVKVCLSILVLQMYILQLSYNEIIFYKYQPVGISKLLASLF